MDRERSEALLLEETRAVVDAADERTQVSLARVERAKQVTEQARGALQDALRLHEEAVAAWQAAADDFREGKAWRT